MAFYAWIALGVIAGIAVLAALGTWAYAISLAIRALHKYVNT